MEGSRIAEQISIIEIHSAISSIMKLATEQAVPGRAADRGRRNWGIFSWAPPCYGPQVGATATVSKEIEILK